MLKGTGIALATPFKSTADQSVDYKGLANLINYCINGGVDYLVSLGTTGETATLSEEEQTAVLDFTIQTVAGRVPVVVGVGGNNTQKLTKSLVSLPKEGISAVLSVTPYYNKPSQEGLFQHYTHLLDYTDLPFILYNVPSRTGVNMLAETTLRLAHHSKQFAAVKEASGNLAQMMSIIHERPVGLVLSGDDNLTLPLLAAGGDGVISVMGQVFPSIFSQMVREGLAGDFAAARKGHYALMQATDLLFAEGNPVGLKAALHILGICEQTVRLPLVPASSNLYHKLQISLEAVLAAQKLSV
jgi:4-hydroxy-tetrahydrodipicolinate synthase